jgi:hypothetical protein
LKKQIQLLLIGFAICPVVAAVAEPNSLAQSVQKAPFDSVPLDHWAYLALQHLARWELMDGANPEILATKPLTRSEAANFVARVLDISEEKLEAKAKLHRIKKDDLHNLTLALAREFVDELIVLQRGKHPAFEKQFIEAEETLKKQRALLYAATGRISCNYGATERWLAYAFPYSPFFRSEAKLKIADDARANEKPIQK